MGRIGLTEIILIFLVILLFFGAKRLPEIGGAIGRAIKEFRKSLKGIEDDIQDAAKENNEKKST